jgi:hypothetical protein
MQVIERPYLARLISLDAKNRLLQLMAMAWFTACRDPKDDKFLGLAVNGHADLILTGDSDLLAPIPFEISRLLRRLPSCIARCGDRVATLPYPFAIIPARLGQGANPRHTSGNQRAMGAWYDP